MKKILFSQPSINVKSSIKLLKKILERNFPNEGIYTKKFELKLSKLLKTKYVISCTNGTSALFLALKAIGVNYDDEIIIPNITFPATANAVNLAGAKVILVDVNPKNLLIDLNDLKRKITQKTKAIIPVHVSGRGENIKNIIKLAKLRKIFVIEDAAEAFMSKFEKKCLGTFGDIGCFSFAPNKIITTGQGGIVITNKKNIFENLKKLKDQGRTYVSTNGDDDYETIGYNFKFTNMQSCLGLSQLQSIKKRVKTKKNHYLTYKKYLKNYKNFYLIGFKIQKGQLPLWVDVYCKNRLELFKYLKKRGIMCRLFWRPINMCKPYKQSFKHLKNSKNIYNKLLWLPSSLHMKKKDIIRICNYINNFNSLN